MWRCEVWRCALHIPPHHQVLGPAVDQAPASSRRRGSETDDAFFDGRDIGDLESEEEEMEQVLQVEDESDRPLRRKRWTASVT